MRAPRLVVVFAGVPAASSRSWFVGGSLAIHVMIGVLVLLAPSLRKRSIPPLDATVVALAGSLPAPSPPAAASTPPASKPSPAKPQPSPPKPEPVKQPKFHDVPPAKKKEPDKPVEHLSPPAPPVPAPDPHPPGGSPGTAPAGAAAPAAGGITALDTGDPEFAWYRASVIAALRSHWTRPVIEDASGAIAATVAFEIRRDGTVQDVRVESPSGVAVMDRSVLRAVIEAAPLPPLPAGWGESTLSARFEFRWRPGESD